MLLGEQQEVRYSYPVQVRRCTAGCLVKPCLEINSAAPVAPQQGERAQRSTRRCRRCSWNRTPTRGPESQPHQGAGPSGGHRAPERR
eukprot:357327-Chlamydomonas_euryale.AAC.4